MNQSEYQFNPFCVLDKAESESFMTKYLEHLRQRDGQIDIKRETLSQREIRISHFVQKLSSILGKGSPLDCEIFYEYLDKTMNPTNELSQKQKNGLLIADCGLLIAEKCNRGECYGVERKLKIYLKNQYKGVPDIVQYVLLEEHYHTRILLDACRLFRIRGGSNSTGKNGTYSYTTNGELPR